MKHEVTQELPHGQIVTMQANMKHRAVRMHHSTLRNVSFTVENLARKYPNPYPCDACNVIHFYKTWHLKVDKNGDTVVSEQVYDRLKEVGFKEMDATKEVIPRPFAIGLPFVDEQASPLIGSTKAHDIWVPPTIVSREKGLVKLDGKNVALGGT